MMVGNEAMMIAEREEGELRIDISARRDKQ